MSRSRSSVTQRRVGRPRCSVMSTQGSQRDAAVRSDQWDVGEARDVPGSSSPWSSGRPSALHCSTGHDARRGSSPLSQTRRGHCCHVAARIREQPEHNRTRHRTCSGTVGFHAGWHLPRVAALGPAGHQLQAGTRRVPRLVPALRRIGSYGRVVAEVASSAAGATSLAANGSTRREHALKKR